MSEVFISYKREDEDRVSRLVHALEKAGFAVWWDRNMAAGVSWQEQIDEALEAAKCVVVAWSEQSVSPAGDFVRDEARKAKARGILVPVFLDKVDPPTGFGEVQAVNLTHWRGSRRDPFFKDLCRAIEAKVEGKEVPPAQGYAVRLRRRITYSGISFTALAIFLALGFNFFSLQDRACSLTPTISNFCSNMDLGNQPGEEERLAWEQREMGSCEALREHINNFPEGAYSEEATNLLTAVQKEEVETWVPSEQRQVLYIRQQAGGLLSIQEAQSEALNRGRRQSENLCRGFEPSTLYRYLSSELEVEFWNCEASGKGYVCGFEGNAICQLEVRDIRIEERCG